MMTKTKPGTAVVPVESTYATKVSTYAAKATTYDVKITEHYLVRYYAGTESVVPAVNIIARRDVRDVQQSACFAFKFYDRRRVTTYNKEDEIIQSTLGSIENVSPTYFYGKEMTDEEVRKFFPHMVSMLTKLTQYCYKKACLLPTGQIFGIGGNDMCLKGAGQNAK